MEFFILLLTICIVSFSVVESRSCTSINRIEKIKSKEYSLKCQNSDDLFNIHIHHHIVVIKCEEKDSKTNEEVNKNDFLSNRYIINAKNIDLEECSWNQVQVLFAANDGLFKDLKITLVSSRTSRVLHEAVSLQPPASLKSFKKIKS